MNEWADAKITLKGEFLDTSFNDGTEMGHLGPALKPAKKLKAHSCLSTSSQEFMHLVSSQNDFKSLQLDISRFPRLENHWTLINPLGNSTQIFLEGWKQTRKVNEFLYITTIK